MNFTRSALVGLLLLPGSSAWAARFAGEAQRLSAQSLVIMDDGGWAAVGRNAPFGGPAYGLVIRADAADRVLWARRADGKALDGVAQLPDGGLLVGGEQGFISRLDAGGNALWEAEIGTADAGVEALSCRGWDCVATGGSAAAAFVLRLDALSGTVTWEVNSGAPGALVRPTAILMLAGGDILLGCTVLEDGYASAACLRLDGAGETVWAWHVTGSWMRHAPNTVANPGVRALLERPDGRTLAVAEDAYTEPTVLEQAADGTPLAALDWYSSPFAPTSAVILSSGRVLIGSSWGASVILLDPTLLTLESVLIGGRGEQGARVLLTTPPSGDAVVMAWPNVGRLALDLSGTDGCLTSSPGAFPNQQGPVQPRATELVLDFPDRGLLGLRPSSPSLVPACLDELCLSACEADCLDGLDDDADLLIDCDDSDCASEPACSTADPDGDGVPNLTDCDPGDELISDRPSSLTTLIVRKGHVLARTPVLQWQGTLPPFTHRERFADVLRGRFGALRTEGNTLGGTCVAPGRGGSVWYDGEAGASSDDFWYLVRPWNACGPGPWDRPELDAGLGGCP